MSLITAEQSHDSYAPIQGDGSATENNWIGK